jgi:hypothetical protein
MDAPLRGEASVHERVQARLPSTFSEECFEWEGAKVSGGYGVVHTNGHGSPQRSVTHIVHEIFFGPIPEGYIIRHKCDNPPCVNPNHLESGTYKQNTSDMVQRDRCGMAKLSIAQVKQIRKGIDEGKLQRELASEFGVSISTISEIKTGQRWSCV